LSVASTSVQLVAHSLRVMWLVDRTTGVPSAYRTLMTPLKRLGAAKAGAPVVPRIGSPKLYDVANTDVALRVTSVMITSGITRIARITIYTAFLIEIYIMCDLS